MAPPPKEPEAAVSTKLHVVTLTAAELLMKMAPGGIEGAESDGRWQCLIL